MQRIEVLTGNFFAGMFGGPGAITNRGSFVGNNAVQELQLDTAAPLFSFVLCNPAGLYWITPRDNVLILSVTLTMPYHYILSRPAAVVTLLYGDTVGSAGVPEFGSGNGTFYVPLAGAEIAVGSLVPWRALGAGTAMAFGVRVSGWVSQVGADAGLNGVQFWPNVAVKVMHTEFLF